MTYVLRCPVSKFDKKSPKGSVPNWRLQICNRYAIRWFKCKLKPHKKASLAILSTLAILHCRPIGEPLQGIMSSKIAITTM